jgi:hypothetical protein
MTYALLLSLASVNDVGGGGVLTLLFPLILVPIVAGLWWLSLRRSRKP